MISICNLSFTYNHQEVLSNLSLEYDCSQFLGIIGNNGGGKSTLIKLILGLIQDPTHAIHKDISPAQIGYVPQHITGNPNFPICVFDLVLMGCTRPFGLYTQADKQRTQEILHELNLAHLAHQNFNALSGGQKQKVLIARALCADSKLLILDEPTAHIDTHSTLEIFSLLSTLHSQGRGIIVVCHDLELLLTYATHIAHLQTTLSLFEIPRQREELLQEFGCKHHIKGNCDA
ncbi:metal ABC transporter ATP-binding protein [Helicobacter pametensis]|uniref:metal ABC transporter ATP-binding protein n=1 Tax=Helicobacter pametensis TaxID=95149 RepID=UPI0004B3870E|nr:ATP-binding cassette domain-containing protein [Helicobacter pametensis]